MSLQGWIYSAILGVPSLPSTIPIRWESEIPRLSLSHLTALDVYLQCVLACDLRSVVVQKGINSLQCRTHINSVITTCTCISNSNADSR